MTDQLAHSLIGASSMSRLIACPGSFNLSQQVTYQGRQSSIWSATGTAAHALAESVLTGDIQDPVAELDSTVLVDGHSVTVDADMVEAVRLYVDHVRERTQGATWTEVEARVCLDGYFDPSAPPPVSAFGTADVLAYHAKREHLDVIDYKNGAGVFVDVVDNAQLNYYAAGGLLQAPGPVTTVDLVIVQPNFRGQDKVRPWSTTAIDVMIWVEDVLKPTIEAIQKPGASLALGTHCRFCPAKASCPAARKLAQDSARRDFGPSPDALADMDDATIAAVIRDHMAVAVHVDALLDIAEDRIKAGTRIPGFIVAPTRPMRSWSVPGERLEQALSRVSENAEGLVWAPRVPRTPAALEKLLTTDEWDTVSTFVQSKSSGVKLVPDAADPLGENSGRPAAKDDFA